VAAKPGLGVRIGGVSTIFHQANDNRFASVYREKFRLLMMAVADKATDSLAFWPHWALTARPFPVISVLLNIRKRVEQ
jgi:hypothetical protein